MVHAQFRVVGRTSVTIFAGTEVMQSQQADPNPGNDDQQFQVFPPSSISSIDPPAINGSPTVGSTFSATQGTWSPPAWPYTYTYHWDRCAPSGGPCATLDGGQTYDVTDADAGCTLQAIVTASSGNGSTNAVSAADDPGPGRTMRSRPGSAAAAGIQAAGPADCEMGDRPAARDRQPPLQRSARSRSAAWLLRRASCGTTPVRHVPDAVGRPLGRAGESRIADLRGRTPSSTIRSRCTTAPVHIGHRQCAEADRRTCIRSSDTRLARSPRRAGNDQKHDLQPFLAHAQQPDAGFLRKLKSRQMRQYHDVGPASAYAEDALVPVGLGGSASAPANLWPEQLPLAKRRDLLEQNLNRQVCSGTTTLRAAQRQIIGLKRRAG